MKFHRLGTSEIFVSQLGFGAMTFGKNEGYPTLGGLGQVEANALVARAALSLSDEETAAVDGSSKITPHCPGWTVDVQAHHRLALLAGSQR